MRRIVFLAIFGVILATPSCAGDTFRPDAVTPTGAAHTCIGFYPEAEREAHVGGVVSLAFHIMPAGTVSNVVVTKSSGNENLDDAAKICVRTWRYAPVLKQGTAVEASWSAEVEWQVKAIAPIGPLPVLVEQDAACQHYPWWAKKDHIEGNAKLTFTVAPDGSVGGIVVDKSSGNGELAGAALQCLKSQKYRPHSGGDTPKAAHAVVTWSTLGRPYSVNWKFDGVTTETLEATSQLKSGVITCLGGASGRADLASGFAGATTIWVSYDRGELDAVSVLGSSGNDALDRFAVGCFKSQPENPQRAHIMRHVHTSKFLVIWQLYIHS